MTNCMYLWKGIVRGVAITWGTILLYLIGCLVYYPFFTDKLPSDVSLFLPIFFIWMGISVSIVGFCIVYLIYHCFGDI